MKKRRLSFLIAPGKPFIGFLARIVIAFGWFFDIASLVCSPCLLGFLDYPPIFSGLGSFRVDLTNFPLKLNSPFVRSIAYEGRKKSPGSRSSDNIGQTS
jgi:hypothetical protein